MNYLCKFPKQILMLAVGIALGPYAFNLIAPQILEVSADLRQVALVIILIRAGLSLDINDLRRIGRPAVLMCFIPATIEIAATVVLAPLFFGISHIEAAIMGAVLAAVSPAVVVPRMIGLMESGYGKGKGIPQLIMAGTSVNGVFVIVLFTLFMGIAGDGGFDFAGAARTSLVPLLGFVMAIVLGNTVLKKRKILAGQVSRGLAWIWIPAEIMLFVLVGATVNIQYAMNEGFASVGLIFAVLVVRFAGTLACLLKTKLNTKERIFCGIAYTPKATVQAAIGATPLIVGIAAGGTILTVAVVAILVTAPLGAIGIDVLYKKTLEVE